MSESPIRAEQIEGLEGFLRTIVREEIARLKLDEDVEQLKKTPAGAITRVLQLAPPPCVAAWLSPAKLSPRRDDATRFSSYVQNSYYYQIGRAS